MKRAMVVAAAGLLAACGVFTACGKHEDAPTRSASAVNASESAQAFGVSYYEKAEGPSEVLRAFDKDGNALGVLRMYRDYGDHSDRLVFDNGKKTQAYDVDQVGTTGSAPPAATRPQSWTWRAWPTPC
jgi:hypothetical protein